MSSLGEKIADKVEGFFERAQKVAARAYVHESHIAKLFQRVEIPEDLECSIYTVSDGNCWTKTWIGVSTPEDASILALAIVDALEEFPIVFKKEFYNGSRVMITDEISGLGRIKIEVSGAGGRESCEAICETKETIVGWKCPESGW